ncbi:MAG: hypothetical protein IPL06_12515 [Betaproteobacteria bacterium]|nr:hypothetical protein [Betaproteobacteria bacterium]
MTPKAFDSLVRRHFGELLSPHGFSAEGSRHSTFWRRIEGDLYHFILADPLRHSSTYDVKVFFSSPRIDENFAGGFPDSLGIPSDTFCQLNAKAGITYKGSHFPCANETIFIKGFEQAVRPALVEHALPYLDALASVEAMLALVRHPSFRLRGD